MSFFQLSDDKQSFWSCFSMYRNAKKLFSYDSERENLTCINGIKVLSTIWVIFGHRFLINGFAGPVNSLYLLEVSQKRSDSEIDRQRYGEK